MTEETKISALSQMHTIDIDQKNLLIIKSAPGENFDPDFLNILEESLGRWMKDKNPIFTLILPSGFEVKLEKIKND